jgi:hypothetical protein
VAGSNPTEVAEVASDTVAAPDSGKHDPAEWRVKTRLAKFDGDLTAEQIDAGEAEPFEVIEDEGNLLLIGGVSAIWEFLIGNGTATAAQALTYFNNGNARIGVGTSSTTEADTQTALQTAGVFQAMDATYPTHTDSTGTAGSKTITFRATFGTATANQAWNEWGIDNGTRLLNRKVAANGTKASGQTWQFTVTVSLA